MGFIQDNLTPDERIVYQTKIHWNTVFPGLIIWTVSCLIAFAWGAPTFLRVFFIIFFIMSLCDALISYPLSEFAVTNRRVLIKADFLRESGLSQGQPSLFTESKLLLTNIDRVEAKQSILGQIFNYGTIVIMRRGGTKISVWGILAPLEFRNKIQEQIEIAQESKSGRIAKVAGEVIECPQCGKTNPRTANFCGSCGADMQSVQEAAQSPTSLPCPKCRAENSPDAKFCQSCGSSLSPAKQ